MFHMYLFESHVFSFFENYVLTLIMVTNGDFQDSIHQAAVITLDV